MQTTAALYQTKLLEPVEANRLLFFPFSFDKGFLLCECAPSDKVIAGFHVPAATDVTIDWFRINMHAPIWSTTTSAAAAAATADRGGERHVTGYDFYPDRFAQLSQSDYRYSSVGYGCGMRKCLGQHLASLTMRIVLFEVVSRYNISAERRLWDIGFRRDKFILTPKSEDILFTRLAQDI